MAASADNPWMIRTLCAAVLVMLTACSPTLDWRAVTLPGQGLQASLPCKPEQVQRSVELAGTPVDMHMSGCEADSATFAIACAVLQDPAQTGAALTHWRAAVLAGMQAPSEGHAGAPQDTAFVPAGALDIPPSVRTEGGMSSAPAGTNAVSCGAPACPSEGACMPARTAARQWVRAAPVWAGSCRTAQAMAKVALSASQPDMCMSTGVPANSTLRCTCSGLQGRLAWSPCPGSVTALQSSVGLQAVSITRTAAHKVLIIQGLSAEAATAAGTGL